MLSLALNIILPVVILTRFSGEDQLGPVRGFIVALAFPLVYGLIELYRTRKFSFNAGLGIASVLLTGGIGLLQLDPKWVAVKEAGIPLILALVILVSAWLGRPLVKVFLNQLIDQTRVQAALSERGTTAAWERKTIHATYLLASSFLLSATLNYILAKAIVQSQPGTTAFNQELGRMTALSFPIITVPVMLMLFVTIFFIIRATMRLTGLNLEGIVVTKQAA